MARTKKRIFDGLYAQLEETDGNVVLFSAKGEPSVIFEITNPVQQLCTHAEQYMLFQDVLSNVVQTLGEGYALQKQDVLCKQSYHHEVPEDAEFLTKSYFRYFEGREFTEIRTYIILTQEAQRSQFVQVRERDRLFVGGLQFVGPALLATGNVAVVGFVVLHGQAGGRCEFR